MQSIVRITYPFLWVAVFARQLCLPVPAIFFLMTAGALAGRGELRISFVLAVSTLGCVAADVVWFQTGRRWGSRIIRLLCSLSADPRYCVQRARGSFDRWGLPSLMVVKFLPGLDAITPPLAGAEGASRAAFLGFDAVGALLWSSLYAGLGYFFADSMNSVAAFLSRFATALVLGIGVPLTLYIGWRTVALLRMIHYLRLRRLSPSALNARLEREDEIAIIDLFNFEDGDTSVGIPGAIRINAIRLRNRSRVIVPKDLEIVLCCLSEREIISARVALALRRKGISRVWILEGGLRAWIKQGYPVTTNLGDPKERAMSLGIQVSDWNPESRVSSANWTSASTER
jgi:membrane protein DedA with SNARE-associated domain/rhodanese-related sulfurtransferase